MPAGFNALDSEHRDFASAVTDRPRLAWPAILSCALFLFTAVPVAAQVQEDRRGFIGIGIGPSAPFGAFADATPANARAGRAMPGYIDTFLNVGYRFGRRLGAAAAFSYGEYVMRDGGEDDWWQVAGLTAGPMYSHRLGARAAVDLKALIGLMTLTPIVDGYTTSDRTGSGFALETRATIRYDVFRRWAVFAEGGVQSSSVSFVSGRRTDVRTMISGLGIAFRPAW